jgi:hypothetical protein
MFPKSGGATLVAPVLTAVLAGGCDSEQAVRVMLPVVVDREAPVAFDTDLGYRIELTKFRAAFDNVEFTTSGEMHASLGERVRRGLSDLVVPTAYAHPGHYAGGEVIGEMQGRFVVDWLVDGATLGDAELLTGTYTGANFVLTRARLGDGIPAGDPIIGHTFEIEGTATRDGQTWTFHGFIDEEDGRRVVGLPVGEEISADGTEFEITKTTDITFGLQLLFVDPFENDTAFDAIDFAAADEDGDGDITLPDAAEATNHLVRTLQTHDHYAVRIR